MPEPHVRIFLDDQPEPIADYAPPAEVTLDTKVLSDGEHQLRIEAQDRTGSIGTRRVPFMVRNGPGITVSGLPDGATVHGSLSFMVNAFGAEEPFEPHRAESRSPIPVWIWVLSLVVVAWAAWYVATLWTPPPEFANTPTFAVATMGPFR
jgi:hypothetical protein